MDLEQKGFSLIEIIAALVIIGLLASCIVFAYMKLDKSSESQITHYEEQAETRTHWLYDQNFLERGDE